MYINYLVLKNFLHLLQASPELTLSEFKPGYERNAGKGCNIFKAFIIWSIVDSLDQ